ncbi:UNKNOWN [Stylonychia lemnae]|uniref:YHYH domain-containing protein n=1 Tax=Stylonychia lemnae TaxID=5949 RepID=A0A078A3E1_STYLE|nr:UNKNOWN [Stylonychia lemnae]|eukprot:CDW76317.1 UNKNOWN [Stylonychia lemnae]
MGQSSKCSIFCDNQSFSTCLDGNNQSEDWCDENCQVKKGYTCLSLDNKEMHCQKKQKSEQNPALNPVCGNGMLEMFEECDDFNSFSTDGCDSSCRIELGFTAIIEPNIQQIFQKQCELREGICLDQNKIDDDGCDSSCLTEQNKYCIYEKIKGDFKCYNREVQIFLLQYDLFQSKFQESVDNIQNTGSEYNDGGDEIQCRGMKLYPDGSCPPCQQVRKAFTDYNNEEQTQTGMRDLQLKATNDLLIIMTPSLPNHCSFPGISPKLNTIHFQVQQKNRNSLTGMLLDSEYKQISTFDGDDQNSVNNALCDGSWTQAGFLQQINPDYVEYSGYFESIVGIALNGVPIHTGNSEYGSDVFYPKQFGKKIYSNKKIKLDSCLGSAEYSGYYHYYGWSPCILPSGPIKCIDGQICDNIPKCKEDKLAYALSFMQIHEKTIMVIGIARDGHSILGPYKRDGTLWQPCDIDLCNGVEIAGIYYYVTTMFHPYTVGCWGPGPNKTVSQECSNNVKMCSSGSLLKSWMEMILLASILVYTILN